MTRVQSIVDAIFEAKARKPKKAKAMPVEPAPALPTTEEPIMNPDEMASYVASSLTHGDLLKLLAFQEKGVEIYGSVNRTSNHYSHSRTVVFDLDAREPYEFTPEESADLGVIADKVQDQIGEEVADLGDKIYWALEREWDYKTSEEACREAILANGYVYGEDGTQDDGDIEFNDLGPEAQARAIQSQREREYRDSDTFWSECIIEEWTKELEEMGFDEPKISWSGFRSQGDGASFTCSNFDLQKYANFFLSHKDTERGHPYTDQMYAAVYKQEAEDAAAARAAAQAQQPPQQDQQIQLFPPQAESLVARMLESEDELKGYADAAIRNVVNLGTIMDECPVRYMSGARSYEWHRPTPDWVHNVKVKAMVFSDELPEQPWDISLHVSRGVGNWWILEHSVCSEDEKTNFSITVSRLIPQVKDCTLGYTNSNPEGLVSALERIFNNTFGTDEHFERA